MQVPNPPASEAESRLHPKGGDFGRWPAQRKTAIGTFGADILQFVMSVNSTQPSFRFFDCFLEVLKQRDVSPYSNHLPYLHLLRQASTVPKRPSWSPPGERNKACSSCARIIAEHQLERRNSSNQGGSRPQLWELNQRLPPLGCTCLSRTSTTASGACTLSVPPMYRVLHLSITLLPLFLFPKSRHNTSFVSSLLPLLFFYTHAMRRLHFRLVPELCLQIVRF